MPITSTLLSANVTAAVHESEGRVVRIKDPVIGRFGCWNLLNTLDSNTAYTIPLFYYSFEESRIDLKSRSKIIKFIASYGLTFLRVI